MKASQAKATEFMVRYPKLYCIECGKEMEAPYGRWSEAQDGMGGTCSRHCEFTHQEKSFQSPA